MLYFALRRNLIEKKILKWCRTIYVPMACCLIGIRFLCTGILSPRKWKSCLSNYAPLYISVTTIYHVSPFITLMPDFWRPTPSFFFFPSLLLQPIPLPYMFTYQFLSKSINCKLLMSYTSRTYMAGSTIKLFKSWLEASKWERPPNIYSLCIYYT